MLDGFAKVDPATTMMTAVSVELPKYVCDLGRSAGAKQLDIATGNLCLITFNFLLHAGEYMVNAL